MSVPAAYMGLIVIWATTPLAIKWSGENNGFLFGVSARMLIGGVVCAAVVFALRSPWPWHRRALRTYAAATVGIYGAMGCVYWGAQYIPSGLVSVIYGLSPLATGIMASLWLNERAFTSLKLLGMLTALAGLAVIFHAELNMGENGVKGILAVLASVLLHSFSSVWVKRGNSGLSPQAIAAGGLVLSLPLFALTWLVSGSTLPQELTLRALAATIYLGVFGSVVGFIAYFYVLHHVEAAKLALLTLITPVLALLLGQLLNAEKPGVAVWLGTALVISGLFLHQIKFRRKSVEGKMTA